MKHTFLIVVVLFLLPVSVFSQEYEIEVYESNTQAKGNTEIENHSNFIFDGSKKKIAGTMYSNHLFDETIEVTYGFTSHFESALYLFTTFGNDSRSGFAGARIRSRIGYSQTDILPVGLSISVEFGKEDPMFFGNNYGLEIKSVLDRHFGKLYLCLNPTIEFGWDKNLSSQLTELVPCYAIKYNITEKITAGIEYYTDLGKIQGIEPFNQQGQVLFPSIDMEIAGNITVNAGLGFGLNQSSDNLVFKFIIGKSF